MSVGPGEPDAERSAPRSAPYTPPSRGWSRSRISWSWAATRPTKAKRLD
jgi:hypothetical protein